MKTAIFCNKSPPLTKTYQLWWYNTIIMCETCLFCLFVIFLRLTAVFSKQDKSKLLAAIFCISCSQIFEKKKSWVQGCVFCPKSNTIIENQLLQLIAAQISKTSILLYISHNFWQIWKKSDLHYFLCLKPTGTQISWPFLWDNSSYLCFHKRGNSCLFSDVQTCWIWSYLLLYVFGWISQSA